MHITITEQEYQELVRIKREYENLKKDFKIEQKYSLEEWERLKDLERELYYKNNLILILERKIKEIEELLK